MYKNIFIYRLGALLTTARVLLPAALSLGRGDYWFTGKAV
jgi:hypothetical protein